MFSRQSITLLCGLALSLSASAQESSTGQAQAIASVQELLILDAGTAANIERQRYLASTGKQQPSAVTPLAVQPEMTPATSAPEAKPEAGDSTPEAPAEDELVLLGIFGFGHQLRAEVSINGGRVMFEAGRSAPISGAQDTGYKLVSLKTPCAVLANSGGSKNVCITRSVGN